MKIFPVGLCQYFDHKKVKPFDITKITQCTVMHRLVACLSCKSILRNTFQTSFNYVQFF